MSIKQTFRSFTASTWVLEAAFRKAVDERVKDKGCKFVNLQINADWIILSMPAKVAFLAFSIELGLKTLLIHSSTQMKPPRGHNLENLFKNLPLEIQELLLNDVETLIPEAKGKFNELLSVNSANFEQWRYFHESSNLFCDLNFMGNLLNSIHNYTVKENY